MDHLIVNNTQLINESTTIFHHLSIQQLSIICSPQCLFSIIIVPQLEYAPTVNQQPEFSQPDSDLIVSVNHKGDEPIEPSITYVLLECCTVITHNAAYQADDLDVYDSDCDELNTAKVALIENLSHYGLDDLTEVHNHDNVDNTMINQAVQATVQNSKSIAQQDALILSVIEQLKNQVVNCTKINIDDKSVNDTLTAQLERDKEQKAQQLEPKLYDGNVIKNTSAIVIPDSEETLMLAEESHSKMLLKQQDPIMLEKKVNTTPVDYNNFVNSSDSTPSSRPTKVEVPKELPKVSMVNTSLKKLKHHLAGFDVVFKERTTATTITEGS
ncbi:hypothetical protein Tco_1012913 [Tanacetum coccineum]